MRILAFLAFAALITIASPVTAAEFGTKDEAVAMVKRVQAEFKKAGADATFKEVSDKAVADFHDRDLYPFIYNMEGICVAHGARAALIGKNLIDLKDQDGKFLIREMVSDVEGTGQRLDRLQMAQPDHQQDRRQVELRRKDGRLLRRRRRL